MLVNMAVLAWMDRAVRALRRARADEKGTSTILPYGVFLNSSNRDPQLPARRIGTAIGPYGVVFFYI